MTEITDQMIETVAEVLSSEGADTEHGWHGWRCFDKDRYPEPCSCTADVALAVLEAVAPLIAAQALRELATDFEGMHALFRYSENPTEGHPWEDFIDEPATWLRDRADQIRMEAGQ